MFTLATDLTVFSNIEVLSSKMHLAILQALAAPGDFDFDGDVDGRDFLAWQRGGSPNPLSSNDLSAWQGNYGFGAIGALAAVPEPSGLALLGGLIFFRYRHQRLR